jgi:hypothetical protein
MLSGCHQKRNIKLRWNTPVETEDGQYRITSTFQNRSMLTGNMLLTNSEFLFISENNIRAFIYYHSLKRFIEEDAGCDGLHKQTISVNYLITTKKIAVEMINAVVQSS